MCAAESTSKWESKKASAIQRLNDRLGSQHVQHLQATWGGSTEQQRDGMILSALAGDWSYVEIVSFYGVGAGRVKRLRSTQPDLPAKKQKSNELSPEDTQFLQEFIAGLATEPGMPCAHRKAREYLDDGDSLREKHRKYAAKCEERGKRAVSKSVFFRHLHSQRPLLRPARLRQDVCNACFRLNLYIQDTTLTDEERDAYRQQRAVHVDEAVNQRRSMNALIAEYVGVDEQPLEPPCVEDLDSGTDDDDDETDRDSALAPREAARLGRSVEIECEDYGQSLTMPFYGLSRPNVDYFHSDLHVHMFVIANVTQAKDYVYLYDERAAGKGGDALCSLRWLYHCALQKRYLDCDAVPPAHVVKILDNCVGQNKSVVTYLFDAFLSVVLYDVVTNMYLLPGHSHMRADTVVSTAKSTLRRKNIFHPDGLADRMNEVSRLQAAVITNSQFMIWESFLRKFFKPPPAGFTNFYFYRMSRGLAVFRRLATTPDSESVTHVYCVNPASTRAAIMQELFRLPVAASLRDILGATVALVESPPLELKKSKLDSLSKKYDCIPSLYRDYYPQPAGPVVPGEVDDEPAEDQQPARPPGRPPKPKPVLTGQRSIMTFFAPQANPPAP